MRRAEGLQGVKVVHINWLHFSASHYRRGREERFSLHVSQPECIIKHSHRSETYQVDVVRTYTLERAF